MFYVGLQGLSLTIQSSLIVCELLALDKLVASIGAIALWPYRMGACSHKQVINIFCMILAFSVIIYEVLKILLEKWPKLCLIEAILGYLVLPHKQRLKAI